MTLSVEFTAFEGAALGDQEDRDVDLSMAMVKGDSIDLETTLSDYSVDPPEPVDLSAAVDGTADRPAVIRFSVKERPEQDSNLEALLYRTSYDPTGSGVEVLDQAVSENVGKFIVKVDKADTEDDGDPELSYRWDLEVSRQGELRTDVGTVTLEAGETAVVAAGIDFIAAGVRPGDIFQPLGAEDNNDRPCLIVEVVSATELEVEWDGYSDEATVAFEIRRGQHITVRRGPFAVLPGVVAK